MYYNLKKHKEFLYLDLIVYLIPISLIFGNLILNSLCIVSTIIYIALFYKKKINYTDYKSYFNLLYILLIFFIINLTLSSNFNLTIKSLFGFLKNYLLFLIILFCLNEIDNFKKIFSKIIFFLIFFVIIDLLIQNFFLIDIFGNEINTSHGRRLAGPFGDEGVAGSFISKLIFLSFFYIIDKKFINKFIFPIIILAIITTILTNERSASIMLLSSSIIFFIFYKINFFYKIFSSSIIILALIIMFNLNNNLKSHFIDVPAKAFKDNHHKAHFLTAYEIFKENKFFGSGIKTFRTLCSDKKYEKINTKFVNNRCSTHPHNIYFEILAETGILGLLTIIGINLFILFFLIINFFKKNNYKNEILLIFCCFYILFWPLQTTGAFFSTWNGFFYFIFFSYFFNLKKLTI